MTLKLTVRENPIETGEGIYYKDDYTLQYKTQNYDQQIGFGTFLLIYDTLTIDFLTKNRHFFSLDSYTNKDEWIYKNDIALPKIDKKGILEIEEGFDDDDRYSFKTEPQYEFSSDQTLKIILIEDSTASHYQISSNLYVGIKNHLLTSIYITNLEIK